MWGANAGNFPYLPHVSGSLCTFFSLFVFHVLLNHFVLLKSWLIEGVSCVSKSSLMQTNLVFMYFIIIQKLLIEIFFSNYNDSNLLRILCICKENVGWGLVQKEQKRKSWETNYWLLTCCRNTQQSKQG